MKGKEILLIAISSFILTVIWIASNVYHSYATSTIDTLLQLQILPISPSFDAETIEKIKQRQVVKPATTSLISATPTPTLSPTQAPESVAEIPTPTVEAITPSITTPTEAATSVTPTPIESGPTP